MNIGVVSCSEVWVCREAIHFGDGNSDAFIYSYLSLFVVFSVFLTLSWNIFFHSFSVFFAWRCCVCWLLFFFCFCGVLSLVVFLLWQGGDLVVQVVLGVDFFFLEVPVWPLELFLTA